MAHSHCPLHPQDKKRVKKKKKKRSTLDKEHGERIVFSRCSDICKWVVGECMATKGNGS